MFFLIAALSLQQLQPIGVSLNIESHRGHRAVHVLGIPVLIGSQLAMVKGMSLQNGVIEADIAGAPRAGSPESARGFVGIAFHADADGSHYECFYLRPTNGRADDQVRRNHSTQYISEPDYDFARMRKEAPERYESYVDLVPGEWTHIRIEVDGVKARLYVNHASQPTLIVNDLKLGERGGGIALWIGDWTEAWVRDVTAAAK
jgi:hypothetical protein